MTMLRARARCSQELVMLVFLMALLETSRVEVQGFTSAAPSFSRCGLAKQRSLDPLHSGGWTHVLRPSGRNSCLAVSMQQGGDEDNSEHNASQRWAKDSLQRKVTLNVKWGFKKLFAPRVKLSVPAAVASLVVGSFVLPAAALLSVLTFLPEDFVLPASTLQQDVAIFENILADLEVGYVDKIPTEKLFETGVQAMLSSLDPYTEFENNKAKEDLEIQTFGRYGGVGLSISEDWKITPEGQQEKDQRSVRVLGALQGYAFDEGLRPGDHLLAVDGVSIQGSTVSEVTSKLRGEPGTDVKVVFKRDGQEGTSEAVLHRKRIRIRDVPLAMSIGKPADGVGYVKLGGFAVDAGREVRGAILALQKNAAGGRLNSLVLDLRGNPGGLLSSAVEVAENFLPPGTEVVTTRGRAKDMTTQYKTERPPVLAPETKVVVMTDGRTASAAEIVAASLQDHDRALVLGQKTYGKGLVQQVSELPYDTSLKFTVAKYYTPSGRCIQSVDYNKEDKGPGGEAGEGGEKLLGKAPSLRIVDAAPAGRKVKDKDRKTFVTDKGRKVRDGGGVEPDVVLAEEKSSELELQLGSQNAFDNFAASFAAGHADVVNDKLKWRDTKLVDDQVYSEFVDFTLDRRQSGFELRTRFDSALDELGDAFAQGGYGSLKAETQRVVGLAREELKSDFTKKRKVIETRLEDAIRRRVEPEALRMAHILQYDVELEAAVKAAKDDAAYKRLLATGVTVGAPPATQDKVLSASTTTSAAAAKNGGADASIFPPSAVPPAQ